MLNKRNFLGLCGMLIASGLVCGCGTNRQIVSGAVPAPTQAAQAVPAAKPRPVPLAHYIVKRHDCLWAIAGKAGVYGDSFQWPLLFKANRDEIRDPDLIYPHQDLKVQKAYSFEDRNRAKQVAAATPKFVPHSTPRETLPVDYF